MLFGEIKIFNSHQNLQLSLVPEELYMWIPLANIKICFNLPDDLIYSV